MCPSYASTVAHWQVILCVCVCACVSKSGALEVEAHLGQEFKAHDEEILQVICDDIFLCLSLYKHAPFLPLFSIIIMLELVIKVLRDVGGLLAQIMADTTSSLLETMRLIRISDKDKKKGIGMNTCVSEHL